MGFIFAFPLRRRGTTLVVDEGNAISTYERLSQPCIVYKHKEIINENKRVL